MSGSPFSANVSLAAATRHMTTTTDSNIFYPEVSKVTNIGTLRRKKYWLVCDGQGNMYGRLLDDPIKTLERLAKLKKRGDITEEDYKRAKDALLDKLV